MIIELAKASSIFLFKGGLSMSLIKKIDLSVKDYTINLSTPLKLYKGDTVTLVFKLQQFGYEVVAEPTTGMTYKMKRMVPINPLGGVLLIESPENKDSVNCAEIRENVIIFKLDSSHTSNLGISKMQIVLEGVEEHRAALPPFDFEVRDIIAEYDSTHWLDVAVTSNGDVITTRAGDRILYSKVKEV